MAVAQTPKTRRREPLSANRTAARATDALELQLPDSALPADVSLPWRSNTDTVSPAVEQHVSADSVVVRFEIPGIDNTEDIVVMVASGALHVEVTRQRDALDFGVSTESEFRYGPYQRTVDLPAGAQQDSVEATYRNGVLSVHVAVDPAAARSNRVTVQRAD